MIEELQEINDSVEKALEPAQKLPAYLNYCLNLTKPGLSVGDAVSEILETCKKNGLVIKDNPDGTMDCATILVDAIVRTIYKDICEKMVTVTTFGPIDLKLDVQVAGPGGVYTGMAYNTMFVQGDGGSM